MERGVAKFETVAINRRPTSVFRSSAAPLKWNSATIPSWNLANLIRNSMREKGKEEILLFSRGAERTRTTLRAISSRRVASPLSRARLTIESRKMSATKPFLTREISERCYVFDRILSRK